MGRPQGSTNTKAPKYCEHRRSGRAYVRVPGHRKPIYLEGKHGSAESVAHYHRLLAEVASNGGVVPAQRGRTNDDPTGPTVAELIAAYFTKYIMVRWGGESLDRRCTCSTIRHSLTLLDELYGPTPAADFTTDRLIALRDAMISKGHGADGEEHAKYRRRTINAKTWHVICAFKWGAPRKLVDPSVYSALLTVGKLERDEVGDRVLERVPKKAVDDATVEATLPFCPPAVAAAVKLQRRTGMRSGELLIMRGVDIDTTPTSNAARAGCPKCRESGGRCRDHACWIYRPTKFKGQWRDPSYIKEIPLGPRAQEIVRPLLHRAMAGYLFRPADAHEQSNAAVRSTARPTVRRRPAKVAKQVGSHYTTSTYYQAVSRAVGRAEAAAHEARPDVPAGTRLVPTWHPHQLRHAHATEVEQVRTLEDAAASLDHRSTDVTKRCAHERQLKARDVAAAVG